MRRDACFPCSQQCLIDKVQVCPVVSRGVNSGQRPRQFQLLPLQQLLTQIHLGYNWSRVHFIYGPSPFIIWSFSITDKDFCQKFMRKLLHPQLGLGSEERKKCLWCKQTALGCLLESLFAQLVVQLSMELVANLKPRFPLLTTSSPIAHTTPVKFTM